MKALDGALNFALLIPWVRSMSLVYRTDFEEEEGRKVDKAVQCVHTLMYRFDQAGATQGHQS